MEKTQKSNNKTEKGNEERAKKGKGEKITAVK